MILAYDIFLIGHRSPMVCSSTASGWINSTCQFWVEDQYMPTDHMMSISEHWRTSKFVSGAFIDGAYEVRSTRGKP